MEYTLKSQQTLTLTREELEYIMLTLAKTTPKAHNCDQHQKASQAIAEAMVAINVPNVIVSRGVKA